MAFINYSTNEINFKIVYWGPMTSGKTTCLEYLLKKIKPNNRSKMVKLQNVTGRTLFFDFFSFVTDRVHDYRIRIHLYGTPGKIFWSKSRALILKGVDGIIFVADCDPLRFDANIESLYELREHLNSKKKLSGDIKCLVQLNKSDLCNIRDKQDLIKIFKSLDAPIIETQASEGTNVIKALKFLLKSIISNFQNNNTISGAIITKNYVFNHNLKNLELVKGTHLKERSNEDETIREEKLILENQAEMGYGVSNNDNVTLKTARNLFFKWPTEIIIFIASSNTLKEERERIELELSRKNDMLFSKGVYLKLHIWEKLSSSFSSLSKQNELNDAVIESDIFICLIFDQVGKFTFEEYKVAYFNFLKKRKPRKIYVFFKNKPIKPEHISEEFLSVLKFKAWIRDSGQFYSNYNNLEDLILQINKNIENDIPKILKSKKHSFK